MEQIGRYKVVGRIGEGAMGFVYRGVDPIIQRDVAIKVFKIEAAKERAEELRGRFLAESKAVGRLDHPNIVTVYDAGFTDQGAPYLVMEYLHGTVLTNYLVQGKSLSIERLRDIFLQLLDALAYAHSHGIIHRDIKPANIMLTETGRVKLMDFGIAKMIDETTGANLTQSGMIIGTPGYMSPEQVSGKPIDHRSDLFSLGVVFWECLTLKKAFAAETIASVAFKIVYENLPDPRKYNPRVPSPWSLILSKVLQKEPEKRFQTADEFIDALIQADESGRWWTLTQRLRWMKISSSHGRTALLLTALGLAILAWWGDRQEWWGVFSEGSEIPTQTIPRTVITAPSSPSATPPLKDTPKSLKPQQPIETEPPPKTSVPVEKRSQKSLEPLTKPTSTQTEPIHDATSTSIPPKLPEPTPVPTTQPRGYLTIRVPNLSVPVYIDGKLIGRTPLERMPIPVRPQGYRIRIVGPSNQQYEKTALILPNQEFTIEYNFQVFGRLRIDINQPAQVFLDGKRIGEGRMELLNVPVGKHRIRVVWGTQTHEEEILVEYPGPTEWRYRFPP